MSIHRLFFGLVGVPQIKVKSFKPIHSCVLLFLPQVPQLSHLNLAGNLMGKVPFVALAQVRSLRSLNLAGNRVEKVEDPFFASSSSQPRMKLDRLDLSENNMETLNER